jgi:YggT family protein
MIARIVHFIFLSYTMLIFIRVVGSWFPVIARYALTRSLMQYVILFTDPYLNLFRRLIPPIGGALDLSPLLAFFGLQMMEYFLLSLTH